MTKNYYKENTMTVGIVILNYKNYSDTINCIKSVVKWCKNVEYIVAIVDNGSGNNSISEISRFLKAINVTFQVLEDGKNMSAATFNLLALTKNNGYAKGNNVGIKFLLQQNVDNILILNNDIILTSDILKPLTNCLDTHPEIGLISPVLMKDQNKIDYNCCRNSPDYKMLLHESLHFLGLPISKKIISKKYLLKNKPNLLNQKLVYCDIISGACIMAKASIWKKLNGFDSNTFLYYEENILFEKLKLLGLKSALLTEISAIHIGAKATKKVKNTKILKIDTTSQLYYLNNYTQTGYIKIKFLHIIRRIHILLIKLNNKIKELRKK